MTDNIASGLALLIALVICFVPLFIVSAYYYRSRRSHWTGKNEGSKYADTQMNKFNSAGEHAVVLFAVLVVFPLVILIKRLLMHWFGN